MKKKPQTWLGLLALAAAGIIVLVVILVIPNRLTSLTSRLTSSSSEPETATTEKTIQTPIESDQPAKTDVSDQVTPTPESLQTQTLEPEPSASPLPSEEVTQVLSHDSVDSLPVTTIINIESLNVSHMNQYFYQTSISDDLFKRIYRKSYKEDCSVPLDDLRYLRILHYGFDEEVHIGEMIVNKAIADKVLAIFTELYDAKYPIEKMILIDDYDADDEASMEDNNSSCFNYRVIDGSTKLSKHSLGVAIDINPLYNPYVRPDQGDRSVLPVNATSYTDRTLDCPYYIDTEDICYQTFIKYGFTWGGNWTSSKDYQHFQISLE